MNIRCVPLSICRIRKNCSQRGFVSIVSLVLLVILIFMGRGLLCFLQQGAENSYSLRQKMQLRLAAESMAEKKWHLLRTDNTKLQELQPDSMTLLEKGKYEGMDYTVFARSRGDEVYIIATAFCRESGRDNLLEPHFMAKGVLKKVEEKYEWRGWAP